jgi:hypothetical protein
MLCMRLICCFATHSTHKLRRIAASLEVARTACAMHYSHSMRAAGLQRIVAGMAAAALLGSGGAQALLHRCGAEVVMKSCCCEKSERSAPQLPRVQGSDHACCSVTSAPARSNDATPQATLAQSAPVLVSVAFAVLPSAPELAGGSGFGLAQPRSAGPPILRTTCALLI